MRESSGSITLDSRQTTQSNAPANGSEPTPSGCILVIRETLRMLPDPDIPTALGAAGMIAHCKNTRFPEWCRSARMSTFWDVKRPEIAARRMSVFPTYSGKADVPESTQLRTSFHRSAVMKPALRGVGRSPVFPCPACSLKPGFPTALETAEQSMSCVRSRPDHISSCEDQKGKGRSWESLFGALFQWR